MFVAAWLRFSGVFFLTVLALGAALPADEPVAPPAPPAITSQQIEADWLLQDVVRNLPAADPNTARRTTITTAEDAAGAVDGSRTGRMGSTLWATNRPGGRSIWNKPCRWAGS
jgi:hypothetical protein